MRKKSSSEISRYDQRRLAKNEASLGDAFHRSASTTTTPALHIAQHKEFSSSVFSANKNMKADRKGCVSMGISSGIMAKALEDSCALGEIF